MLSHWAFWVWRVLRSNSILDLARRTEDHIKKILSLFVLMALSATLSFAQAPDRSAPNDNNAASNEPVRRGGNFGWIGLIGLIGLAGLRGRREDVRNENVRVRPAA
jgi:hypothetical protein